MILRLLPALSLSAAITLPLASPVTAEADPGAYLAARQAGIVGDYAAAAEYFQSALVSDPNNLTLMEQTITAYLGTGQGTTAASIARTFIARGGDSQIANLAMMAGAAKTEDWDAIFDQLEAGHEVGPLMDSLAQAWAHFGKGDMTRAMNSFDEIVDDPGLRAFGQQHKALALAINGELEAADAIYALPPNEGFPPSRDTVIAHLRILTELGEFERAAGIHERAFGSSPDADIVQLRDDIEAERVTELKPVVTSAAGGIAYGFRGLADVLAGEANESYLLLYAQAARFIAPRDAAAQIAAARLLDAMDQHDAAAQTYAQVAADSPFYHTAELGRAEALHNAGRFDQAIEVLTQLTRSHPDIPLTQASLGDVYRQQENYADANVAYTQALQGYPEDAPIRWWLLFSRGMTYERMDQWPQAEADFRASLDLNPDAPSVLNYLGYSIVDRGQTEGYDEALDMIERAVAARPDNGAIVDSLAWVYYKLGRYQDAVEPMERAAELEPNDPILNDHLGDVYWMVGRETEARFQWRRALSFDPEPDEATRIRRKLEIGLDAVYAEEGVTPAPAVEVANDG